MDKKFTYITLFSFLWSVYTVIRKYVFNQGVDELNFLTWSLFFAVLFLSLYLLIFDRKQLHFGISKKYQTLIAIGLVGNGLSNIFMTVGLKLSTAANLGFLIKTSMAFTIIIAYFVLKESVSRLKVLFVFLMFVGAYLISTNGALIVPRFGDVLIMAGALCNAVATVMSRALLKNSSDSLLVTWYRLSFGFLVTWLFTLGLGRWSFDIEPWVFWIMVVCAILLIVFVWLLNKALECATASYVSIMNMSVSVFVLILSLMFLDETFSLAQALGAVIIILAGIGTVKTKVAETS